MKHNINLKNLERKAYLSYHEDGILDLFIGFNILLFGLWILADMVYLAGAFVAISTPIYTQMKKQITIPRLGYVKFTSSRTAKSQKTISLLIIAGLNDLIRQEGIAWPILLIGAGAFLLYNNFGPQSWISWTQIIRLWPILLIAGGIDMLFKGQSGWMSLIGILVTLVLIGGAVLILWYVVWWGLGPLILASEHKDSFYMGTMLGVPVFVLGILFVMRWYKGRGAEDRQD